jgi:5-methyltetrahydropteroyltriglutamate--homocysteine methyltransferase
MLHFRGGRAAISREAYPDLDVFFADIAAAYRAEIAALGAAGCRYLQLDDTNLAYLCDAKMREGARLRGDDPDELPRRYARLINAAIAQRPAGMTICIHLCRGNFKSAWWPKAVMNRRRSPVQRARGRRLFPRVRRCPLRRFLTASPSAWQRWWC